MEVFSISRHGNNFIKYGSIEKDRSDLVKYFVNEEDCKTYTTHSCKKVQLKCPDCGKAKSKKIAIHLLSNRGFRCEYCGDGVSIPEKFALHLFNYLEIEIETQKRLENSSYYYDFYFKLEGSEYLCETHGIQHYENKGWESLESVMHNDYLKANTAINYGIKQQNYIVIDCRYSEFIWLKENFTKSLEKILDLSEVDWEYIWLNSQKSLLIEVCKYWSNKKDSEFTGDLSKKFKLSKTAIINYLKIGAKLNICKYNPEDESRRSGLIGIKSVNQLDLNGYLIKTWNSSADVSRNLNIDASSITKCCKGKRNSAGNFKWEYKI